VNPDCLDDVQGLNRNVYPRLKLLHWLQEVCSKIGFQRETFYLAHSFVDMALSKRVQNLSEYQLLGVTALYMATKMEEVQYTPCRKFSGYTLNEFSPQQIAVEEARLV
jgi:hypothetical protein